MRRTYFLAGAVAAPFALAASPLVAAPAPALVRMESRTGGRLGVACYDLKRGVLIASYRNDERFPMCSTFKLLLAGCVLQRVDRGKERLERLIPYAQNDLQEYGPVTKANVGRGALSVETLLAAAVEVSDNTAANLLITSVGGPAALTHWLRGIGDMHTRLDRMEPELNTSLPNDVRDTTTPASMAQDVHALLFGNVLSTASQQRLRRWLEGSTTGTTLLRAGFPKVWTVGDKTGMGGPHNRYGDSSTRNDVAVAWIPNRKPIIAAVFLEGAAFAAEKRDAAIAEVGKYLATLV